MEEQIICMPAVQACSYCNTCRAANCNYATGGIFAFDTLSSFYWYTPDC